MDHPILIGAAGLALGAAVAASLPRTAHEDDSFGERSARIRSSAKRTTRKQGRKIRAAAKSAAHKAPASRDLKHDGEHAAESTARH